MPKFQARNFVQRFLKLQYTLGTGYICTSSQGTSAGRGGRLGTSAARPLGTSGVSSLTFVTMEQANKEIPPLSSLLLSFDWSQEQPVHELDLLP